VLTRGASDFKDWRILLCRGSFQEHHCIGELILWRLLALSFQLVLVKDLEHDPLEHARFFSQLKPCRSKTSTYIRVLLKIAVDNGNNKLVMV
jgi:hypothetical protein